MQALPIFFVMLLLLPMMAWSEEAAGARAPGAAESCEIVFEPVSARYFRLVGYSESQGWDRWASVADLQLLRAEDGRPVSRVKWTVQETSNRSGRKSEPALLALDQDPVTAWRSHGEPPHHLDVNLNETVDLAGFRYGWLPGAKGAIDAFAVFVSHDGVDWGDAILRGNLVPRDGEPGDDLGGDLPEPITLLRRDFAPPHMVHGPVAIHVDPRNRVYVAETHRYQGRGVIDNRGKKRREEDDLQTHSLEERHAFLQKWLADGELKEEISAHPGVFQPDGSDLLTKFSEKVVLLEDGDGDGRADRRRVVAEGFNDMLDGAAAGVLVRGNEIYLACVPALWHLSDGDGDDVAEQRHALSRGYGIRTGWFGHDLHGLTWGPDGRLYFSMADRGYHVRTREGLVHHGPDMGAVFRCWPDGSELELWACGLRNPQELAFDDLGYLFTGDNNGDAGDRARLVYVVEGGDSGWRVSVQSLADRGPWLTEAMWELPREEEGLQPAWVLPPLAHINSGPSGIAYYPGTGLPDGYRGYFFLCDYRGGRGSIQAFRVEPKGASFSMSGHHTFHDGPTVSDVTFGYDGRLYAAEWGPGWDISEHARIYTLTHGESQGTEGAREVRRWFHRGFEGLEDRRLGECLGHRDQRVRYEATRILAQRRASEVFASVIEESDQLLARLHALWGLGQLARQDPQVLESLVPFLNDADPEFRGRALRICAEHGLAEGGEAAIEALGAVHHPRLRFHAAYAVGKLRPAGALESLLQLVRSNDDGDVYLRHAAVMGLTYLNEIEGLLQQGLSSASEAVQLVRVLVLRRLDSDRVSEFLQSPNRVVVTEAARAIYDREITGSVEALATSVDAVLEGGGDGATAPFLQRALWANFQLGSEAAADRLCRFARDESQPKPLRELALELVLAWDDPPKREGVWGRWRPGSRPVAGLAKRPTRIYLQDLLELEDRQMQALAQRLDALYGREKTPPQLAAMVTDPNTTESLRVDALLALEKINAEHADLFNRACQQALNDPGSASLRAAAVQAWARVRSDEAEFMLQEVVQSGTMAVEKQAAVRAASTLSPPVLKRLVNLWMAALVAGELDPQIQLDVFEIAENSGDPDLEKQTQSYRESAGDVGIHRLSLRGGDWAKGRVIYETNLAAQCMRCHSLRGKGGDVGPLLDGLANRREPEHILQSVVDPQAEVAKGYGMQTVTLRSGDLVIGTLISEDEETVEIRQDGQLHSLAVSEIADRSQVVSGMPPAGLVLKPRELRDLLAFLQTLE